MDRISATIITRNEESRIERCLNSLQGVADEIVVVDSFSDDRTTEICRRYGCRITSRAFTGYGNQRQYATGLTSYSYILSIDADEVLSEELRQSLIRMKNEGFAHRVYLLDIANHLGRRQLRHCGMCPDRQIRLFNKRYASWNLKDVGERVMFPDSLRPVLIEGSINHYPCADADELREKCIRHAAIKARIIAARSSSISPATPLIKGVGEYIKYQTRHHAFLDGASGNIVAFNAFRSTMHAYRLARKILKRQHRQ